MKFSSRHRMCLVVLLLVMPVWASSVNIRLVEASQASSPHTDPGLSDVAAILRNQLRYNRFLLRTERNHPWRDSQALAIGQGYQLSLSEVEGNRATVDIRLGKRRLVAMRVTLHPERPLCIGPLVSGDDKALIVVLTLRN